MKATTFEARYPGKCGNCGADIKPGDRVFYDDETKNVIRIECCVDDIPAGRADEDTPVRIRDVMPRGRTARDRCNQCFLIHSPHQLDCE